MDHLHETIETIQQKFPPEEALKSKNILLYHGPLGIAFMYHRLYDIWPVEDHEKRQSFLESAKAYLDCSAKILDSVNLRESLRKGFSSFYGGHAGLYAMTSVIEDRLGNKQASQENLERFVDIGLHNDILSSDPIFGAPGYLTGCRFLNKNLRRDAIPEQIFTKLGEQLLREGNKHGRPEALRFVPFVHEDGVKAITQFMISDRFPILGRIGHWYLQSKRSNSSFFGCGHGLAGILYTLMHINSILNIKHHRHQIKDSVDYLLSVRLPSGNYPANDIAEKEMELYHWCHGAPGVLFTMNRAYEVFGETRFLRAAKHAADVTWRKGLLTKGNGLCHGIAGNGYALLDVYRTTKDEEYLDRALKFAKFSWSEVAKEGQATPDNPYSLYEGMAGTALFYADLIFRQDDAKFPAFQC
eukprot:TRINITY_DN10826_c0_g1_i2.p1 TRINITY_DN10826_c0_g1~~TRINITY_DN10826_c0_g1_i2.p1  ORF type:complete len:464 (+),score=78.37 TRINITY_DN10826_c0_g1_i2:155-1393(+)